MDNLCPFVLTVITATFCKKEEEEEEEKQLSVQSSVKRKGYRHFIACIHI